MSVFGRLDNVEPVAKPMLWIVSSASRFCHLFFCPPVEGNPSKFLNQETKQGVLIPLQTGGNDVFIEVPLESF